MASPILVPGNGGLATHDELPPLPVIFGVSGLMTAVRQRIERVALTNVAVLIQGPSGSGKEVIARFLHGKSLCANGPFVKVNCAAIPATLLESELFGYEKGAFTGAVNTKPGRAEAANDGSLFLDEIAEISSPVQAKLLQLLQENRFWRIGARMDTYVNVRVICATSRQLEKEIDAGRFRSDLFYRVNVVKIQLPALRDRAADIPMLTSYFLRMFASKYRRELPRLSPHIVARLQEYHWPGNIRELANLMERYAILISEEAISSELAARASSYDPPKSLPPGMLLKGRTRQSIRQLEREVILKTLEANRWNRKAVAKELNISYRTLLYKIRQTGIATKRSLSQLDASQ